MGSLTNMLIGRWLFGFANRPSGGDVLRCRHCGTPIRRAAKRTWLDDHNSTTCPAGGTHTK